jgi:hypothetical protein
MNSDAPIQAAPQRFAQSSVGHMLDFVRQAKTVGKEWFDLTNDVFSTFPPQWNINHAYEKILEKAEVVANTDLSFDLMNDGKLTRTVLFSEMVCSEGWWEIVSSNKDKNTVVFKMIDRKTLSDIFHEMTLDVEIIHKEVHGVIKGNEASLREEYVSNDPKNHIKMPELLTLIENWERDVTPIYNEWILLLDMLCIGYHQTYFVYDWLAQHRGVVYTNDLACLAYAQQMLSGAWTRLRVLDNFSRPKNIYVQALLDVVFKIIDEKEKINRKRDTQTDNLTNCWDVLWFVFHVSGCKKDNLIKMINLRLYLLIKKLPVNERPNHTTIHLLDVSLQEIEYALHGVWSIVELLLSAKRKLVCKKKNANDIEVPKLPPSATMLPGRRSPSNAPHSSIAPDLLELDNSATMEQQMEWIRQLNQIVLDCKWPIYFTLPLTETRLIFPPTMLKVKEVR